MVRKRIVHLLNDTGFGGVSKALEIYDHPRLREIADSRTLTVRRSALLAPRCEADLILTHFPPNWRALPFLLSLRLRNPHAVVVHVAHSYSPAWEAANVPDRRRFRAMLRIALSATDKVISVSNRQASWLREAAGLPDSKLTVISPWSGRRDLEALDPPPPPDGRLRLAAYGRFDPAKGFDVLVEAMKLLDPNRFSLVLGGFGAEEARLREMARGYDHIRLPGRVDDVAGFLRDCDVVVVPSRWESFGLVALEAKAAGRPLVVADVDELPAQAKGAGLVAEPGGPTPLARTIERMLTAPLQEMGRCARESVRDGENLCVTKWRALLAG